jgi:hypothetical protein
MALSARQEEDLTEIVAATIAVLFLISAGYYYVRGDCIPVYGYGSLTPCLEGAMIAALLTTLKWLAVLAFCVFLLRTLIFTGLCVYAKYADRDAWHILYKSTK